MSAKRSDILSPDQYEAIGRLVFACTELDTRFTELIGALTELHIYDAIMMVHHQQFSNKHDTLMALLRGGDGRNEIDPEMLAALNRARAIYDFRSAVVHALYSRNEEGVSISRFQARGRLKLSTRLLDFDEAREMANEGFRLAAWFERAKDHFLATYGDASSRHK